MNTTTAENSHPPTQKTKYIHQDINQANTYMDNIYIAITDTT
jgi:hypothetical protein